MSGKDTGESSLNGLPHGWIKEVRCRKTKYDIKRDPFYIDPESGYEFRSLKDVFRYINTGDICKCLTRPRKRRIDGIHTVEKESHPLTAESKLKSQGTAAKRCLFSEETPAPQVNMMKEVGNVPEGSPLQPLDQSSTQCANQRDLICRTSSISQLLREGKSKDLQINSELNSTCDGVQVLRQTFETGKHNISELVPKGLLGHTGRKSTVSFNGTRPLTRSQYMKLGGVDKNLPETSNQNPLKKEMMQSQLEDSKPIQLENQNFLSPEGNISPEGNDLSDETPESLNKEEQSPPKNRGRRHKSGSGKAKSVKVKAELELESKDKLQPNKHERGHQPRPRKNKAVKTITMPLRASRRLAALRADHATNTGVVESNDARRAFSAQFPACGGSSLSIYQQKEIPVINLEVSEELESKEPCGEQSIPEKQVKLGDLATGKPVSSLSSLFGDSWPDPCIEFAFKTLTGDIPVLDDTTAMEDYFHQHLGSSKSAGLNCSASAFNNCKTFSHSEHVSLPRR
ncbi:uncharacterized protein [Typha latifolia]|uniref:uncharacterized protein isoform X2 n=1 Tax=Typha latifolia TaxID=4733 RepID=UPI003C2DD898